MKNEARLHSHEMTRRLFFRLLPVQIAIVAMGSVNAIVDGVIAARCIDAATVGVVGLYYTMIRILEASGSVLLGGATVLSGRYLGSGQIDKTRGVCSLGVAMAVLIGAVLTAVSFLAPGTLAGWLGANEQLKGALTDYIRGYAVGIIPQLLAQLLTATLQLERQDRRGQIGITVMVVCNVLLDILFIVVLKMGVFGLALATSVANWAHFLVLAQYYFTDKAQLKPGIRCIAWRELPSLLQTGSPNAVLVVFLAARSLAVNKLLLSWSGQDALSALSAFNMICGLLVAVALGAGMLIRMLSSVFIGEENREGLTDLIRIVLTRMLPVMAGIGVVSILLAPVITGSFFPDPNSEVYRLMKELLILYSCFLPLVQLLTAFAGYCQALGVRVFVHVISLVDGFLGIFLPAILLAPRLGAFGVWLSFPIGLILTALLDLGYVLFRCGHWPRSAAEWLMLPPSFGTGEQLVLDLRNLEQVTATSVRVQRFCEEHSVSGRVSAFAGLCLEETAANIVQHGFTKDRKTHSIEMRVLLRSGSVTLRVKDDCIPFDPKERYEMTAGDDPAANIGIRLIYSLADEVVYQNLLGLNVLTVRLSAGAEQHTAAPAEA